MKRMTRNARGRADPARLGGMRRAMAARIRKGFRSIRKALLRLLLERDVLGMAHQPRSPFMAHGHHAPAMNAGDWAADTSPGKLKRFRAWLRQQAGSELPGDALLEQYVSQGYSRGAARAFNDIRKARLDGEGKPYIPALPFSPEGARDEPGEYVRGTMSKGATVHKVKLLASRTFHEMEDVNALMATRMSRILADGLVSGWGVKRIAREMAAETDIGMSRALVVARTELMRAHAEGQLDAMQDMGEQGVTALVEFTSVVDSVTCPKCRRLEGRTFSPMEARGILPVHPNCRCAWIPLERRKGT